MAARWPHTGLLLEQATVVVIAVGTAFSGVAQWHRADSNAARTLPLVAAALMIAALIFMLRKSKVYWHHRTWLSPLLRIGIASLPWMRKTGVGPSLVLERPPQAGRSGALLDLLRIILGTRVIGAFLSGTCAMLPPLAALVCQTGVTLLISNSPAYCATELLSHPLTRTRMAAAARVLGFAALPLLAFQPVTVPLAEPLRGERLCRASVTFLQVMVGIWIPWLASALCWRPAEGQPAVAYRSFAQQDTPVPDLQQQQQQKQQQQQGPGSIPLAARLHLAGNRLQGLASAADSIMHRLCSGQIMAGGAVFIPLLTVGYTWLCATWILQNDTA